MAITEATLIRVAVVKEFLMTAVAKLEMSPNIDETMQSIAAEFRSLSLEDGGWGDHATDVACAKVWEALAIYAQVLHDHLANGDEPEAHEDINHPYHDER